MEEILEQSIYNNRFIFLDNLPKKYGVGANKNKLVIDWKNSIGNNIHFICDTIEGDLKIININKNMQFLIEYKSKEYKIRYTELTRCQLGNIIGTKTSDFKIEIGTRFQDEKRDITIIDKKKIQNKNGQWMKYYRYKCNKCGFDGGYHWSTKDNIYKDEYWVLENRLLNGQGCSCCIASPQIVVKDINSIYCEKNFQWMIMYFKNIEDSYIHTKSSAQKTIFICPDCGKELEMKIRDLYRYHSLPCSCSDKIPYGEKFITNLFNQFKINFTFQLTKTTFKWCKDYKYDFYFEFNNEQYVVEVNGRQHYEECSNFKMTLKEQQVNDKIKKELALSNGIKEENYIVIDCRRSELEWIKANILASNLNKLFDLSNIDWLEAEKFACSNLIKIACNLWNNKKEKETILDISNIIGYNRRTVNGWLRKGKKFKWCNYNGKEEQIKNGKINNKGDKK